MSYTKKEMHSRDTAVLINLLWFNVVHYSVLFSIHNGPYSSWKFLTPSDFGNTIIMIMIEIHRSRDFKGFHGLFASDRPLKSLYKLLLKILLKFRQTKISVLSITQSLTTRFYNKTLIFTSFYSKFIGNYVWYTISASKIIIVVLFRQVMLDRLNITGEWIKY